MIYLLSMFISTHLQGTDDLNTRIFFLQKYFSTILLIYILKNIIIPNNGNIFSVIISLLFFLKEVLLIMKINISIFLHFSFTIHLISGLGPFKTVFIHRSECKYVQCHCHIIFWPRREKKVIKMHLANFMECASSLHFHAV